MACQWLHYIMLNTTKCYRLADFTQNYAFLVIVIVIVILIFLVIVMVIVN